MILRRGVPILALLTLSMFMPFQSYSCCSYDSSLETQFTPSADTPTLNLTYTSRTRLVDTPIKSGDVIAGDHVILKSEWTSTLVSSSRLEINAPAIPSLLSIEDNETTLEIDTRALGNNATCIITATAWLTNGSTFSKEFTNIHIGNYFVPKVTVLSPNGNETWDGIHTITWTAFDVNADDELRYDVLLSADAGSTFETLVSSTNLTSFEWDCSGLVLLDTYIVRVRVTDGIYFSSDRSDATFTAGTIVTSTPTPTPTPTTTPNGYDVRVVAFVVILLVSCGIMALVVYYAARKWF